MVKQGSFSDALCFGYERLAAWSDLLDRINVFPVADADTGTNLKVSLAPLRRSGDTPAVQADHLLRCATGNSGNIAAAFFREMLQACVPADLQRCISAGSIKARQAVSDPQPGTMLTIFDALAGAISNGGWRKGSVECAVVVDHLAQAVKGTHDQLAVLRQAGVVDAGALGMFIFLEAYLAFLFDPQRPLRPVTEIFPDKIQIRAGWRSIAPQEEYCVSTLLQSERDLNQLQRQLAACGDNLVMTAAADRIKIHLHTPDPVQVRTRLAKMGRIEAWQGELMTVSTEPAAPAAVHIMTDAAGSFTLEDARRLDVTLLDSYLVINGRTCPETAMPPAELYAAMRAGAKVSTAQASLFERRQSYLSASRLHSQVLYLCVGSVYTGNYEAVSGWQKEQGVDDRFHIIDSGTASGRLGIAALAAARCALCVTDAAQVVAFARKAVQRSQEFVFLDQLKYLAAGGRISKTKGFFGDLLHLKPVITPAPHGAAKVAVLRNREEQLAFALRRLREALEADSAALILLQYSDNQAWVENSAAVCIGSAFSRAELLVRPLSLTSGAHMGPGTWAVAFLPPITLPEVDQCGN